MDSFVYSYHIVMINVATLGLIYNNEITVITHYYENCYVKEIVDREDEIVSRIRAKFDEINKKVPISNYTIDFCVDPNSDKVWLIEINNPVRIGSLFPKSQFILMLSNSLQLLEYHLWIIKMKKIEKLLKMDHLYSKSIENQ